MIEQNAILLCEIGKPVELGTRPVPRPGPGQVQAHLSPSSHTSSPDKFDLGDHVFGLEDISALAHDGGGLQVYAILNDDAMAKITRNCTADQAVTLPINAVTSFMAFFHSEYGFGFPAPWTDKALSYDFHSVTMVILAAGSNVGKLGVQFAHLLGIGRIICVADRQNNEKELKKYGATHVVDRHLPRQAIVSRVHEITGEDGVRFIYDCYSWTFELGLDLLSTTQPSRLVTLHTLKNDTPAMIAAKRPLTRANYVPCSNANLGPHREKFWDWLAQALVEKKVSPTSYRVIEGLDVDGVNQALDVYWSAKAQKQVIVHPRGSVTQSTGEIER